MISTLEAAYVDVCARSLGWALGLPGRTALATLTVPVPMSMSTTEPTGPADPVGGWQVELRVLGASHQVLVHGEGALLCSETVACDLAGAEPLPTTARSELPQTGSYEFSSEVLHLDADALVTAVDELEHDLDGRDHTLVGRFPGMPHAITALTVDVLANGLLAWRTWHAYPQAGELVTTRSRLTYPEVVR